MTNYVPLHNIIIPLAAMNNVSSSKVVVSIPLDKANSKAVVLESARLPVSSNLLFLNIPKCHAPCS
jgi:hypothetical protein